MRSHAGAWERGRAGDRVRQHAGISGCDAGKCRVGGSNGIASDVGGLFRTGGNHASTDSNPPVFRGLLAPDSFFSFFLFPRSGVGTPAGRSRVLCRRTRPAKSQARTYFRGTVGKTSGCAAVERTRERPEMRSHAGAWERGAERGAEGGGGGVRQHAGTRRRGNGRAGPPSHVRIRACRCKVSLTLKTISSNFFLLHVRYDFPPNR